MMLIRKVRRALTNGLFLMTKRPLTWMRARSTTPQTHQLPVISEGAHFVYGLIGIAIVWCATTVLIMDLIPKMLVSRAVFLTMWVILSGIITSFFFGYIEASVVIDSILRRLSL